MWNALRSLVGLPAVVGFLFLGIVLLILSATTGNALSMFFGGLLAVICIVIGFGLMFAVYIQQMNEDIDSDRHELRQELDQVIEDADSEE